jgi:hypothetical protein
MKATNKILAGFALLAVIGMTAGFAVNIFGAKVDASTGYTFNGAAPSGHVLCGNGTLYVDAATCGTAPSYQVVQANGTPLTQRGILNFDTNFAPLDTPPATTVRLAATISVNTSGNAATATDSGAVGGVALSGLCQGSGVGCPRVSGTLVDVTSSRSFGTVFTNGTNSIYVSGFGLTTTGGDTSEIDCSSAGVPVWGQQANATVVGGKDGFGFMVPPFGNYQCTTSGTSAVTLGRWTEFVFN